MTGSLDRKQDITSTAAVQAEPEEEGKASSGGHNTIVFALKGSKRELHLLSLEPYFMTNFRTNTSARAYTITAPSGKHIHLQQETQPWPSGHYQPAEHFRNDMLKSYPALGSNELLVIYYCNKNYAFQPKVMQRITLLKQ